MSKKRRYATYYIDPALVSRLGSLSKLERRNLNVLVEEAFELLFQSRGIVTMETMPSTPNTERKPKRPKIEPRLSEYDIEPVDPPAKAQLKEEINDEIDKLLASIGIVVDTE